MANKPKPDAEPKQKTAKGYEIPVPKRGEVFKAFEKSAKDTPETLAEQERRA